MLKKAPSVLGRDLSTILRYTLDGDKTCIAAFGYPVGGIVVPVNKLKLLAPWLWLAVLAFLVAALAVVLIRRRKT